MSCQCLPITPMPQMTMSPMPPMSPGPAMPAAAASVVSPYPQSPFATGATYQNASGGFPGYSPQYSPQYSSQYAPQMMAPQFSPMPQFAPQLAPVAVVCLNCISFTDMIAPCYSHIQWLPQVSNERLLILLRGQWCALCLIFMDNVPISLHQAPMPFVERQVCVKCISTSAKCL